MALDENDSSISSFIKNIDNINNSGDYIKIYFDKLTASGIKVPGTIIKIRVYHKLIVNPLTGGQNINEKVTSTSVKNNENEDKNRLINAMETKVIAETPTTNTIKEEKQVYK